MLELGDADVATARWQGPAHVPLIGEVRAGLLAFARERGMAETTLRDLRIASSEALTNAVRHAYPPAETGEVEVDAAADEECLTVRIADHGRGAQGESLGLGVQIMRGTTDRLEIGPQPTGPGSVVMMEFLVRGRRAI